MMLWTIGHREVYDAILRDPVGRGKQFLPRNEFYRGGIAFISIWAARNVLRAYGLEIEYGVYELDARLDDVRADNGQLYLLRDVPILRRACG